MMEVISLLEASTGLIRRASDSNNGYYNEDGDWVKGDQTSNEFEIKCNVQPLTGEDLKLLPESFRASNSSWLYTTTEIKTVDEFGDTEADTFIIDNTEYVVLEASYWRYLSLSHYKCLIRKKEKS